MLYVVIRSGLIETAEEAQAYYLQRLAGSHAISCHRRPVTIVFEHAAIHLYSDERGEGPAITRKLGAGSSEDRRFSIDRARLMDCVLPAISCYTVSIPGTSTTRGREKRMLHGPRLPDGRFLRVVLRPGPGGAFTCVSAYPVEEHVWLAARRSKRAKFPP